MNTGNSEPEDDIWSDLSETWTRSSDGRVLDDALVEKIERRVRWLNLRSRLFFALEVMVSTFGVVAGGYLIVDRDKLPDVLVGCFALSFSLVAFYFTTRARRLAWGRPASAPAEHLEALLAHVRVGVKLAKLNDYFSYGACVFLGLVFYASERGQFSNNERLVPLILPLCLFLVVVYIGGRIYRRRQEQELERLRQLRRQVNGGS